MNDDVTTTTTAGGFTFHPPAEWYELTRPKYQLTVTAGFVIHLATQPNRFHRFWQRALLGWRWEPIDRG